MTEQIFKITHAYDVGDRSVYLSFDEKQIDETVTELAVYIQFKAENTIEDGVSLDNATIGRWLGLFGAKQLEAKPDCETATIDMYSARERSCGDWYLTNYESLDEKYGDIALGFLRSEAERGAGSATSAQDV